MTLSASCSWPNTPEAPRIKVARPIAVATTPARGRLEAPSTIRRTAWAAFSPTSPRTVSKTPSPPLAPKTIPTTPIAMTSSGAIEKAV